MRLVYLCVYLKMKSLYSLAVGFLGSRGPRQKICRHTHFTYLTPLPVFLVMMMEIGVDRLCQLVFIHHHNKHAHLHHHHHLELERSSLSLSLYVLCSFSRVKKTGKEDKPKIQPLSPTLFTSSCKRK